MLHSHNRALKWLEFMQTAHMADSSLTHTTHVGQTQASVMLFLSGTMHQSYQELSCAITFIFYFAYNHESRSSDYSEIIHEHFLTQQWHSTNI